MILRHVKVSNFMGLRSGKLVMQSGGMLITGENGSGKSTWISALNFAFFGSVPGLTLKEIPSFGETSGEVEVQFDNYVLIRSFDKNSTNLKLQNVLGENLGGTLSSTASDKLYEIFPVPQELFNEIVIKQQGDFGSMTEATPSSRYAIFKKLADVSVWDNYLKSAKWTLSEMVDEIRTVTAKKEQSQRIIVEQNLRLVTDEELNAASLECEKAKEEIALQTDLQYKAKRYEEAQRLIAENPRFEEMYAEWERVKDIPRPSTPRVALTGYTGSRQELESRAKEISAALSQLNSSLEMAKMKQGVLKEGKCYACNRPFTDDLAKFEEDWEMNRREIESLNSQIAELKSESETIRKRISELDWARYEKRERLEHGGSPEVLKSKLEQARRAEKVELVPVNVDGFKNKIEIFSALRENRRMFIHHVGEIAKCDAALEGLERDRKPLEELCSIYDKNGAPKRVIMQWVKMVESEANRQLSKFKVSFIDKSETGRETLELVITNSQTGTTQKFKSLSGGERTRINVAFAVAMNNVYSAITGIPVQTIWFDEVYGLDEFGQQEFAEIIKDVAKQKEVVCATSCFESMSLFFKAEKTFRMEGGKLK